MDVQYVMFFIIVTLWLFLIAMGVQKTTKIFLGNYVAGFSSIMAYLFIDYLIHILDKTKDIKLSNPHAVQSFLAENKTMVVIIIYFIFFILFYKSRLFNVEIHGIFKKIFGFLLFPILTMITLFFTMILLINGPSALEYDGYQKIISSLHITNPFIQKFFNLIPMIIILVPILALILFLEIHIKLPSIKLRRKKKKEEKEEEKEEE